VTCLYFDQEQDLIVSGSLDYDIRFWHLSTGECCQKIDWISKEGHRGVIRTLKADSWRVVSGADDKTIKVINNILINRILLFFFPGII
jgi:F-box/WD-40 domain protein 7